MTSEADLKLEILYGHQNRKSHEKNIHPAMCFASIAKRQKFYAKTITLNIYKVFWLKTTSRSWGLVIKLKQEMKEYNLKSESNHNNEAFKVWGPFHPP